MAKPPADQTEPDATSAPGRSETERDPGADDGQTTLWTIGHGTLPADDFVQILHDADIEELIDVRSFPGSRHNPQYGREEMERWLPESGIEYRWMRDLGGRRRAVEDSKHVALRHVSFRAYADYMETPEFLAGVDELLGLAAAKRVAFMCSESVWWRCHRRLLADHLALVRKIRVEHLMHDGRHTLHPPTQGVRLDSGAHQLVYDVGATPELV